MKKTIAIGTVFCIVGLLLILAGLKLLPDLKPLGTGITLLMCGVLVIVSGIISRSWNARMYIGSAIAALGLVSCFATVSYFPNYYPFGTMAFVMLLGSVIFSLGFANSDIAKHVKDIKSFSFFSILVAVALMVIPLLLFPQIDWQRPADPCAVMILSTLVGIAVIYTIVRDHPEKRKVVIAGAIFVANFCLVPLYEHGFLDFIGGFFRLFEPVYASFDPWAETVEYSLIGLTVLLTIIFAVKKTKVSGKGNAAFAYFIIQPILAIFLFEMLGLPAGFLAGATTRSDLLVTNTNAVMSFFGMVLIAVLMFISFLLLPFWVTPLIAGSWWVFWKPFLLHHPDPSGFTPATFIPAALFLFFTGIKRIMLPMLLLILFLDRKRLTERKK